MKILSVEQIRALDHFTIENEPVPSIVLMERAAQAFTDWFVQKFTKQLKVKIICGVGNNGGDGLAIARLLWSMAYEVEVTVVHHSSKPSYDFQQNFKRLQKLVRIEEVKDPKELIPFHTDIVIDALLGSGLNKPIEGIAIQTIEYINSSQAIIISVDIASGLFADRPTKHQPIVQPDYTLGFQVPKLAFMAPENEPFVGRWEVRDIGLNKAYLYELETPYFYIENIVASQILRRRSKFSHKGTYGHAALIGGSYGKIGAIILAAKACLHAGVGLLTLEIPNVGYNIIQTAVPEAMIWPQDYSEKIIEQVSINPTTYAAIGIGCGLGTDQATSQALREFLLKLKKDTKIVIDADAINLIAQQKTSKGELSLMKALPAQTILTPHPKEFERLCGKTSSFFEQISVLTEFAEKHNCFVILKGAHSAIATPEGKIYFNSTGNPGMATGGSGDVLTGILTGLLAQGYTALEACLLGVYLHGLAGDIATDKHSEEFITASCIISNLGEAFKETHQSFN